MSTPEPSVATSIRAAEPADVPLLLELFGELADYERLRDELHATPEGAPAGRCSLSARPPRR